MRIMASLGKMRLEDEHKLTLREATLIFTPHPHWKTVGKWCRQGCGGILLESYKSGWRRCTTKEACYRFMRALTEKEIR